MKGAVCEKRGCITNAGGLQYSFGLSLVPLQQLDGIQNFSCGARGNFNVRALIYVFWHFYFFFFLKNYM